MNNESEVIDLVNAYQTLSKNQQEIVINTIKAFNIKQDFWSNPNSDLVNDTFLANFGNRLIAHHVVSKQALSKDKFEFAFEASLNESGFNAELAKSRTNRGHDITIESIPVSLKTEAAKTIKIDTLHISKWMELGKGEWELNLLLHLFLEHMNSYERIFSLRRFILTEKKFKYELVEIPKSLMLESKKCELQVQTDSSQNPQPGYGFVYDTKKELKFALYFDGGTERKLQIKRIRKDLCIVHAIWNIESSAT